MNESSPHRKKARKFNVSGHAHFMTFSCYKRMPLLTNDVWRKWLAESVRTACDTHEVSLWAYVFMPEHVHLLVRPQRENYNLAHFEKSLKLSASKRIINSLTRENTPLLQSLVVTERPGKVCYCFWQEGGGHDKNIWSMELALQKASYCHNNPVKRGLVCDPSAWRWSSFRWLEMDSRLNEALALDDWSE